jgi:hypothetical protein
VINLNIAYEPRNISGKFDLIIYQKSYFISSVVPSGSVFRLCGRILHISFLDHKGVIIPSPSEKWDTKSKNSI